MQFTAFRPRKLFSWYHITICRVLDIFGLIRGWESAVLIRSLDDFTQLLRNWLSFAERKRYDRKAVLRAESGVPLTALM
jgi:hypothetical protein